MLLKNMVFYGYHGVAEQEKILGGRFEVDVELVLDMSRAMETDRLSDTINYETVYHRVEDILTTTKYYLIEKLAGKIARTLLTEFNVEEVTVRIRKPNAPLKGVLDYVQVEISRKREEIQQGKRG